MLLVEHLLDHLLRQERDLFFRGRLLSEERAENKDEPHSGELRTGREAHDFFEVLVALGREVVRARKSRRVANPLHAAAEIPVARDRDRGLFDVGFRSFGEKDVIDAVGVELRDRRNRFDALGVAAENDGDARGFPAERAHDFAAHVLEDKKSADLAMRAAARGRLARAGAPRRFGLFRAIHIL